MSIINIIKKTPMFHGINLNIIEDMAKYCHQKSYVKDQELFETGDPADAFYIILEGWIKLFRISREGEETIIHIFGAGESFAEAAVFRRQRTYPVTAQAVSNVKIIEIPRSFLTKKIEEDSSFALIMLGSISSRQHYLVGQLEQITSRTAPQRIGSFLLQFCQRKKDSDGKMIVELPYDKSLISTRLNIKPETFSRALTKLEPHGIISKNRQIIINDIKKLTKFCDINPDDTMC